MVLKTKEIELSDGTKITLSELSYASQLRLQKYEVINMEAMYKEMLGDQYDLLEQVGKKDASKITTAFVELTKGEDNPLD